MTTINAVLESEVKLVSNARTETNKIGTKKFKLLRERLLNQA